jgi:hypothetical protein
MEKHKLVLDYLNEFFKSEGFKKKGQTWYRQKNDSIILCNYQKSAYSDLFYLNFGIVFIELLKSEKIPPPYYLWHWGARYEKFLEKIKIDFSTDIKNNNISEIICALDRISHNIKAHILPILSKFTNFNFLKTITKSGLDHEILQLKNIKLIDFLIFVNSKIPKN